MKIFKYIIIVVLLTITVNQNVNAQTFVKVGGQATDIAMSAKDGSVYVVNAQKNIKKYNTRTKKFLPFGAQLKNAKSVSVTKDGVVYMVNTSGEVSLDVNGRWIKVPGIKTDEVICGKNGTIAAIDDRNKMRFLKSGKWNLAPNPNYNRTISDFNQVNIITSKEQYARDSGGKFKQWKQGRWRDLNGQPNQIALDQKAEKIYAVGRNKGIYKWLKQTQKWVLLPGTRKDFVAMAVHDGKIWAVSTNKTIYYYDTRETNTGSNEENYAGTYRVTVTKLLSVDEERYYGTIGAYLDASIKSGKVPIKPLNNLPNRLYDIPRSSSLKAKRKKVTVPKFINSRTSRNVVYNYFVDINKIREFRLLGEAANNKADFSLQFNMKSWGVTGGGLFGDKGGYHSQKINIKNLELNKEYFFMNSSPEICIGFKIEKTN
ncbi:tectonin domain-containing protein [Croceitalea marina]|uniref:Tectonin domain-containing protein n=1 Tax=Croceitalea marina TaxID=1775166 RepID=A0ABW5N1E9_9FLAO